VIRLLSGIFDGGEDIFLLKKRILSEDFLKRGVSSQQFQDIGNTDTEPPNARASSTFPFFYGNALESFYVHSLAF
jgi:hypothetical protein